MDMRTTDYHARRSAIAHYFDRTAADAWARLTSDAPVSRIRATVRAGRDRMRGTLLDWLPADLRGQRVLDAGCGTGSLAVAAARRGAEVVAIDLSATLVGLARDRLAAEQAAGTAEPLTGTVQFLSGDMTDPALGRFDHVVAMDSLIHYEPDDVARVLSAWAPRCQGRLLFTVAPRTPALAAMHAVGRLFPRGDRAPAIVPQRIDRLQQRLGREPALAGFAPAGSTCVAQGFYTSQAMRWQRAA